MSTIRNRAIRTGVIAAAAGMVIAGITPALASGRAAPQVTYTFSTLDNSHDPTFNQLLGINNHDRIAGFYGSGAPGHPNRGYLLSKPYSQSDYHAVRYPGSSQTEVTGLNDTGVSVGIYANPSGAHFGFYLQNGGYHKVTFPTGNNSNPPFNELLGISGGLTVGDFTDAAGGMQAYRYSIVTHRFFRINIRNSANVTATGINGSGTIVGFFTNALGQTVSFLRHPNGTLIVFSKSGAVQTQAFGINDGGLVVGAYTTSTGATVGFTWRAGQRPRAVNDPSGVGFTVLNGVNNAGDLVGFYTDSQGRMNGLLATP
jgi:hypothetical protein